MAGFDIFVSPSLWEAMPIVLIEALALGLPIVATDVGDNSRVIGQGVNGLVVPPGDMTALAYSVLELIASDELRLRMQNENGLRFEETLRAEIMVKKYEQIYERLNS